MRLDRNTAAVIGDLLWDAWKPESIDLHAVREQFSNSSVEEVAIVADFFTVLESAGEGRPLDEPAVLDLASTSFYAGEFLEATGAVLLDRLAVQQLQFDISLTELRIAKCSDGLHLTWADVRQIRADVSSLFDTPYAVFDFAYISKQVCLRAAALISPLCPYLKDQGLDIHERVSRNLQINYRPGLTEVSPDDQVPEMQWLLRLQCATETACVHVGTEREALQITFLDPYHCHECYVPLRCRPGETRGMLCLRYLRLMASTMCHEFVHVLQSLTGQASRYWQMEHDATFLEFAIFHMISQDTAVQDLLYPGAFSMFMYDHVLRVQHFVRAFDEAHWSCVSSWISSAGAAPPPVPEQYNKAFGASGSEDFGPTEIDVNEWSEEDWLYLRKWCNAHGYDIEGDSRLAPGASEMIPPLRRTSSVRVKIEGGKILFSSYPPSKLKTHILYAITPACSYQGAATPESFQLMLETVFKDRTGDVAPISIPSSLDRSMDDMTKPARETRGHDWCVEVLAKLSNTDARGGVTAGSTAV